MTPPLAAVVLAPLAGALFVSLAPSINAIGWIRAGTAAAILVLSLLLAADVVAAGPLAGGLGLLYADALSAFLLVVVSVVLLAAFAHDAGAPPETLDADLDRQRRREALVLLLIAALIVALLADHAALLWIGFEVAALLAGLVLVRDQGRGRETAFAYLVVSLAAGSLALLGTALLHAGASQDLATAADLLGPRWSQRNALALEPALVAAALALAAVGYGARAGLASYPAWLAAPHDEAPPALGVVLSAALANVAIYALLRYQALASLTLGTAAVARLVAALGLGSLLVALLLVLLGRPLRRRLTAASFAHLGLAVFAIGVGGAAVALGLLHLLNHALCRTLLVLSRAGERGSLEVEAAAGSSGSAAPIAAGVGLLALAGLPPSATFTSAFAILSSSFAIAPRWVATLAFLAAAAVAIGLLAALADDRAEAATTARNPSVAPRTSPRPPLAQLVLLLLALSIVGLGLARPAPLGALVEAASLSLQPVAKAPRPAPLPSLGSPAAADPGDEAPR